MASMAQLNVRMAPEVKAAGDSVLELYGISPSEFVRTIWEKIGHGEEAFRQVARALAANPAAGSIHTTQDVSKASETTSWILHRQAGFEHEVGLNPKTYESLTNEQLNDLVYEDYLEERNIEHAN